ncbi:uncharacterized protein LOC142578237 isoform X2 [Dermacentor variabilis]|uniref:uncharacterized protein LOC142578182 n=1 Tax=Dermacentor variabilis TaxID=34621 RepID=UPI003F5B460F
MTYCNRRNIRTFSKLLKDSAVLEDLDAFIDGIEAEHDIWLATLMWNGECPEHVPALPILRENDIIRIDYMVGMVGGRIEVCSRLVRHGERPSNAHQMSPSEFCLLLKARAAQQDIPAVPGKLGTLASARSTTVSRQLTRRAKQCSKLQLSRRPEIEN